jgi:hypothetical protein
MRSFTPIYRHLRRAGPDGLRHRSTAVTDRKVAYLADGHEWRRTTNICLQWLHGSFAIWVQNTLVMRVPHGW